LHAKPQDVPSQVAAAFAGGGGHGVQELPQLVTDWFDAHAPLQTWLPEAQAAAWHCVPAQVNVSALGQGAHRPPHAR
jgi:hypothetical protein